MSDSIAQSEPWDRQPGEPNLWYSRFERYRLAGPSRSLLGTLNSEMLEKGLPRKAKVPGAWNRACERWHWRERAEGWDEHERHKAQIVRARDVEEMNRRHIQEAQALQNKALQRLKALAVEDLSAADVLRYFMEATKLERSARGEPETIEERRLTGKNGALLFSFEDAVTAELELQEWQNDRLQPPSGDALPEGNPQVP
ncbi:MAG TPA: hypothetical protein VKE24_14290 [Candidatus Acidoferrales bacterium]|nr:hypothetical protein [Candidatus Acidoferrales bacterium]